VRPAALWPQSVALAKPFRVVSVVVCLWHGFELTGTIQARIGVGLTLSAQALPIEAMVRGYSQTVRSK
jgi:hypothetical protein